MEEINKKKKQKVQHTKKDIQASLCPPKFLSKKDVQTKSLLEFETGITAIPQKRLNFEIKKKPDFEENIGEESGERSRQSVHDVEIQDVVPSNERSTVRNKKVHANELLPRPGSSLHNGFLQHPDLLDIFTELVQLLPSPWVQDYCPICWRPSFSHGPDLFAKLQDGDHTSSEQDDTGDSIELE